MKKNAPRALGLILAAAALTASTGASAQMASPSSSAQTRSVNYDMLRLQTEPQVIDIYPNMKTPVFFDDQLLEIVSGNPELFNLDINANRTGFYISATGPAGMTDLYVTTASNITAMFIIKLHPVGLQPQRIEVSVPRNVYGTQGSASEGATWSAAPGVAGAPGARTLSATPIKVETVNAPASTTSQTTTVQTTTTTPASTTPASTTPASTAPVALPSPGLSFKTSREGNTLKVDYTLVPDGTGTFNPKRMSVRSAGREITYSLIRRGGQAERAVSQALPEQAVIAIRDVHNLGPVTITWVMETPQGEKTFAETFNN